MDSNTAKMQITALSELKPGEEAVIHAFRRHRTDETYLMEMGLTVGTRIKIIKFAPLGDPIEMRIRGYHLSIRHSEAENILVKKENVVKNATSKNI